MKSIKGTFFGGLNSKLNQFSPSFFQLVAHKNNPLASFRIFLKKYFISSDPVIIQECLKNKDIIFKNSPSLFYLYNKFALKNQSNHFYDNFSSFQDQLYKPFWHKVPDDYFLNIFINKAIETSNRWQDFLNNEINIVDEIQNHIYKVNAQCIFGTDLMFKQPQSFDYYKNILIEAKKKDLIYGNLSWLDHNIINEKKVEHEIIKIIETKNNSTIDNTQPQKLYFNFVSSLLDEPSSKLNSFNSICDLLQFIYLNSLSVSVQHSLSWAFYCIHKFPKFSQSIEDEINRILGKDNLNPNTIFQLPQTKSFLLEILRHYPPVDWITKSILSNTNNFVDFTLNNNTNLYLNIYALHTDENYWKNSAEFDPTRFLYKRNELKLHKCFYPFGDETTNCFSNEFYLYNILSFFVIIIRKYKPIFSDNFSDILHRDIGLSFSPKNKATILLRK